MSYEPVLIYMTTADLNEAERLGELLLQKRTNSRNTVEFYVGVYVGNSRFRGGKSR